MASTADMLFDFEDAEQGASCEDTNIKPINQEMEAITRRLELTARHPSELARQLYRDVTVDLQYVKTWTTSTSIAHALASRLAVRGYDVCIRVALGGGADCFKSLRHEFLVVRGADEFSGMEFIVEPSLRQHFAIPHPSPEYAFALAAAPDVFVGGSCRLVAIVQLLCALMADSFTRQGLALPPWRKEAAMMSKWLPQTNRMYELRPAPGTCSPHPPAVQSWTAAPQCGCMQPGAAAGDKPLGAPAAATSQQAASGTSLLASAPQPLSLSQSPSGLISAAAATACRSPGSCSPLPCPAAPAPAPAQPAACAYDSYAMETPSPFVLVAHQVALVRGPAQPAIAVAGFCPRALTTTTTAETGGRCFGSGSSRHAAVVAARCGPSDADATTCGTGVDEPDTTTSCDFDCCGGGSSFLDRSLGACSSLLGSSASPVGGSALLFAGASDKSGDQEPAAKGFGAGAGAAALLGAAVCPDRRRRRCSSASSSSSCSQVLIDLDGEEGDGEEGGQEAAGFGSFRRRQRETVTGMLPCRTSPCGLLSARLLLGPGICVPDVPQQAAAAPREGTGQTATPPAPATPAAQDVTAATTSVVAGANAGVLLPAASQAVVPHVRICAPAHPTGPAIHLVRFGWPAMPAAVPPAAAPLTRPPAGQSPQAADRSWLPWPLPAH